MLQKGKTEGRKAKEGNKELDKEWRGPKKKKKGEEKRATA